MIRKSKLFRLVGVTCLSAFMLNNAVVAASSPPTPPTLSISPSPSLPPSASSLIAALLSNVQGLEGYTPYLHEPLDQKDMLLPPQPLTAKNKSYMLAANATTAQWGFFDSNLPPILRINSGDTVIIETHMASNNQIFPGVTIKQLTELMKVLPIRGPHTVTGPIYVNGAEPGDILQIKFNKIIPRAYASNDNLSGLKGLFPDDFPKGQLRYFYLDMENKITEFAPGIVIPLAPFPGIVAVARKDPGKYNTIPPGPFGGNLDLREMTAGSTLYLPVFMKGALVWSGDSHGAQGNGEINLTALETAFKELNVTINVIKTNTPLEWPRVETPTAWIAVGYDADLNKAFEILQMETIKLIAEKRNVSPDEAEKVMLETWNCPIAEVVNGIDGVYCMIPKDINAPKPVALLKEDNADYFASYGKDPDMKKAMSIAAMAMINKVSAQKKMSRLDVYSLASLTMDCRIAKPKMGDNEKEVHCTMAKSLWVS